MANTNTNRDQNTAQQPNTSNTSTQQGKADTAVGMQSDRERPIASGRENLDRGRTGMVRQRGNTTVPGTANSPFAVMQRMSEDMDRLFEQFGFGRTGFGLMPRFGPLGSLFDQDIWSGRDSEALNTVWTPQVETLRRGDKLVIRADIPGVAKDDVHVDIENDVLTISGERKEEHEEDRDGYYRSERSYGQFYRAIPLPDGVNTEKCDASFKDGVLEVTIPAPKQQERKAKRIQVR